MELSAVRWLRPRRPSGPASAALVSCLVVTALAACGHPARSDSTCDGELSGSRPTYITAWFHDGGTVSAEAKTLREQVDAFNAVERDVQVRLITLPVGDYARQVTVAAAHGGLPDVLDFDGPNLYNYAWSGKLEADRLLCLGRAARGPPALDPSAGHLCRPHVGHRDVRLGPRAVRAALDPDECRDPHPDRAGRRVDGRRVHGRPSAAAPGRLRSTTRSAARRAQPGVVHLRLRAGGLVGGRRLIDRATYRKVDGFLNGPPAVHALTTLQQWYTEGYVDRNTTGDAFEEGRSPISWIGHWFYDRYSKAFPGDVQDRPSAELRQRTATDSGSWQWGITSNATDGDAVWRFLQFLLTSGGSASDDARERRRSRHEERRAHLPEFARRWAEHLYIEQLEDGVARSRPQTPAYPALSARVRACIQRGRCPGTSRQCLARCGRAARRT